MDRPDLTRYLRQLGELGGPELFLDSMTADEVRAAIAAGPAASGRGQRPAPLDRGAAPVPAPAPARRHKAPAPPDPRPPGPLRELEVAASGCTLCRLHAGRKTVVFGEGDPAADLVVVGEAPGQEEDRTGRPFVGRAGKLLDLLLMAAGFPRGRVYICNVLKCRPPDNRNPQPDEVGTCTSTWLHRQIELITPRVLLAVGKFAAQALTGSDDAIGRLRGRVHAWRGTPLVVSYHPAYLLRSPNVIRDAWLDYQLLRAVLDEQA
jgi:DNA polymerase